ncbi:MAG: YiiG family protein [Pyrinomonadaceae bacterium]
MLNKLRQNFSSRNLSAFICVVFILGATLGCKRISELANRKTSKTPLPTLGSTPDPVPGKTEVGSPGDTLVKKTNSYISECFNKYSNSVVDSYNRYALWVKNMEQGPTGKEMNIYGLYDVNGDGADCEKAVNAAKQLEPSLPEIEAAADKYLVALKAVLEQIKGVYKYYEQEDYKDDNFAKGKQAHAGLVAAFKDFREVNTVFADEVDNLEDQVAAEELEKLRGVSGKQYDFLVVESGIKAKKIKTLLQDKQFEQITADELTPLIEDFDTTVQQLIAEDSKKTMAGQYVRACEEFTKASKEMMRRIRDKKPFTDSERRFIATGAGWMVDGSPAKITKAYNDMIQARRFNMRF